MKQDENNTALFVGRQAIYDHNLDVFAYELLYRHSAENRAVIEDADLATSKIITNIFFEIGLENIVGSKPAFVNITGDFFTGNYPLPMSHEQIIFEFLEDIEPTAEVIAGVRSLHERGYRIALDDYLLKQNTLPLLELASFVKLDILAMTDAELEQTVEQLRGYSLKLIAEKVETPAQYRRCRELGFNYFQGYFFAQPDVVQTSTPSINRGLVIGLIARLRDPAASIQEIEHIIAHDAVLSYRLLRYINSATFALRREVDSIRQALMLLGLESVRKWITLILLSQISQNKPRELMTIALIRARMCEILASVQPDLDAGQAFTVGLFSLLDALLDQPMEDLLDQIPLSVSSKLALLNNEGSLGELLKNVVDYERGRWDGLMPHGEAAVSYSSAYLSAVHWADDSSRSLYESLPSVH